MTYTQLLGWFLIMGVLSFFTVCWFEYLRPEGQEASTAEELGSSFCNIWFILCLGVLGFKLTLP